MTRRSEAQRIATQEKQDLYNRFDQLFTGMETAVSNTAENLTQTKTVNEIVQSSVKTQSQLLDQTAGISSDVGRSLTEQQKVLKTTNSVQAGQNQVITNTLRALLPFKQSEVAVRYTFKYPLDAAEFQTYKQRLERTILEKFPDNTNMFANDPKVGFDRDAKHFLWIEVPAGSSLLPGLTADEDDAATMVQLVNASFHLYVNARSPDQVSEVPVADLDFLPDTFAVFRYDPLRRTLIDVPHSSDKFSSRDIRLDYTPGKEGIYITITTNNFSNWMDNTGRLSGFVDLRNSLLSISQGSTLMSAGKTMRNPRFYDITFLAGQQYSRKVVIPAERCFFVAEQREYCRIEDRDILVP